MLTKQMFVYRYWASCEQCGPEGEGIGAKLMRAGHGANRRRGCKRQFFDDFVKIPRGRMRSSALGSGAIPDWHRR